MGWISKDGKEYKTLNEKFMADNAWDKQREEQQRQISLLNEQNRIIREQAEQNRIIQQQLESEKQQHEKEMRLLNLCDNIGISKKNYDNYIKFLTSQKNLNKISEMENQLKEMEDIEVASNKGSYYLNHIDLSNYKDCYEPMDTNDKIRNTLNILKQLKEKEKKAKNNNSKNLTVWICICSILLIISLIVGLEAKDENIESIFMILTFIFLFVDSYIIIKNGNSKEKIKAKIESCEKIIEEEKERIKKIDIFSVEKLIKKKDILINELTKLKEDNNNVISKRNDDFFEFRKKHYNKDIEKFLLDMELPEVLKEYGIDFKSVNNNSKTKNGKVEDYIDYFIDNK